MDRRDFLKASLASTAALAAATPALAQAQDKNGDANTMTTVAFKDGEKISLLGFGMMRLPQKDGEIDRALAAKMVDDAIRAGVNYFDTAYFYIKGKSETFCGDVLTRYPRDSYYLADKLPIGHLKTADDLERIFSEQLRKTRQTHFDFYLMHALNANNWKKAVQLNVYDFLLRKKAEGKIRHIGFSFHDKPEVLEKIAAAHPWDFAQIQLNYIDWKAYRSKEQYDILTSRNIPIVIMEPLRGGRLANLPKDAATMLANAAPNASQASWAFRYIASLPNILCILSGMSRPEHLADNLRTFSPIRPLDERERRILDKAILAYHNTLSVPCTDCRYCLPCPAGVLIPRVFTAYNDFKMSNNTKRFKATLAAFDEDEGPGGCIKCGKCMPKCPQHIRIPVELERVAKEAAKL
ncbi:MAG: aldo/keto reductase [Oligosphaeraceae bacterium]